MPFFLSKTIKIIAIFIGGCICLISLMILPFAIDVIHNETRLILLNERTKKYIHPLDSQLLRKISISGNFARASNQCGFIVAEVHTTTLNPNDIRKFYTSILTDTSYDKESPYHEVKVYILTDKKDVENIELLYPDVYERIIDITMTDTRSYLLLTTEVGYPPNNDPRCH